MASVKCGEIQSLVMGIVYFTITFAFFIRLLVNQQFVPNPHVVYLSNFFRSNDTSVALFDEHPSALCVVFSLVYGVWSLYHFFTHKAHGKYRLMWDGFVTSVLLIIVAGILDLVLVNTLIKVYLAFLLLGYWMSLYQGELEKKQVLMLTMTMLITTFWFSIVFQMWISAGIAQLFSCTAMFLDMWLFYVSHSHRPSTSLRIVAEEFWRHTVILTLLISVFVITL